jgi:tripartite-type tricarboxylate transporter receptor subunit TctC
VLAGEVPLACSAIEVVRENVKAGRLRALAVTGARRVDSLPGTPTVAESGFPGFEVVSWYGILAPSGTPPEVVNRVHAALVRLLRFPDVAEAIAAAGQEAVGNSPEQFAAEIRAELIRGRAVVDALKIRVD